MGSEMCIRDRAPDYAFKIGESIKFLVEAKKPFVNLAENPEPAYQLRYYAWNAKLPISCLLYTSDAADDLLCVDLGGRRIIKKKKKQTKTTIC